MGSSIEEQNCETRNEAWLVIFCIIVVFVLLFVFWSGVYLIVLTAQPDFLRVIERTAEFPAEDAPPDYNKMSIFSAIISILITAVILIILAFTKCKNFIPIFNKKKD